ncbi:hypothetical protein Rhe02_80940 [Rhizocola hellebori]|uniref:WXG100 family type VII secretion target n=1 Tax=Rhizocola hellebori TaxID=1392758 RepID=A0A8J3QI10_9ACTN|nr:hypothetical protein [Rhizocola hellebori]GIH10027.1 hypothetical protein Rhe02_80940 [Rhizocola hellebori]
MTQVAVELGDLRGWAQQVGRASGDMDASHDYATTHIADADFGKILELITGDYAALIGKFHDILSADSDGLGSTRDALSSAATAYHDADEQVAGNVAQVAGQATTIVDDGVANGFDDGASAAAQLITPGSQGATLPDPPEVSFGWILDKVCELVAWVGGPDLRVEVTRWIAGDVDKAARHVGAWQAVANCLDVVEANLASGKVNIGGTWTGTAAAAAIAHMDKWSTALTDQSSAMRTMAQHLADAINEAVKMAQVVVDIIRTIVSVISAGLANAAIPFYGQWKLISSVKEAITMIWSAIKVIQVFWNMLNLIIDTIQMAIASFSRESLPPAPAAVPA